MNRTYFTLLTTALALSLGMASAAQAREQRDDAQQPPIQARPGGPEGTPKTDQTVDVTKGTRLVLTNNAGEVVVRTWDKDQVRIQATHSARESVDAQTADMTLRVRTRSLRGPSGLVDYQVTVPRWMAVNLSGTYLDTTIEGTTAEVTVETVHGNARVTGGSGSVTVKSIDGIITIDKASGRVQATTVNEGIRVTNVTGEISAETTNGDIVIDNAQSSNLEASTVNGDVTFNGSIKDNGVYRLTTHGGDIRLGLGGVANATVFVRTFQGDFAADFPIQLPEGQSMRSGSKRFNFTLGNGSARIEVQSFNGDIVLARKAVVSKEEERDRRRGGRTPMAAPPAPPAPPAPGAPPAPKPPKPPGWNDGDWDDFANDVAKDLTGQLGVGLGQGVGTGLGDGFGQDFGQGFEKHFEETFEKNFEKSFKEIEKSLKTLTEKPRPQQ
ncbi:MAG: DUF4097 family beta strand repeat-containing protein [Vicinamibacterales bacterium]